MSKRPELFNKVKVIGGLLKGHYGKVVYDLLDGTYKVRIDNDNVYLIDCYNLEVIDGLHSDVDKDQQIAILEKALKLACERVKYFELQQDREMGVIEFFEQEIDYDLQAIISQYKEQAKEILKNE